MDDNNNNNNQFQSASQWSGAPSTSTTFGSLFQANPFEHGMLASPPSFPIQSHMSQQPLPVTSANVLPYSHRINDIRRPHLGNQDFRQAPAAPMNQLPVRQPRIPARDPNQEVVGWMNTLGDAVQLYDHQKNMMIEKTKRKQNRMMMESGEMDPFNAPRHKRAPKPDESTSQVAHTTPQHHHVLQPQQPVVKHHELNYLQKSQLHMEYQQIGFPSEEHMMLISNAINVEYDVVVQYFRRLQSGML